MVQTHKSFPSIYTWIIYNEGWGQLASAPELYLTPEVMSIDPTRLIDSVTGWFDHGAGDYSDNHHVSPDAISRQSNRVLLSWLIRVHSIEQYSDSQCGTPFYSIPSRPYDPKRIGFQGEFGGIGNNVSIDHLWSVQEAINTINQTYELDADIPTWNYRAHILLSTMRDQIDRFACSGGVWTQTTDVEGEVNGLLTYDRRILRTNVTQWQEDIQALYDSAAARANGQSANGVGSGSGTGTGSSSSAYGTESSTVSEGTSYAASTTAKSASSATTAKATTTSSTASGSGGSTSGGTVPSTATEGSESSSASSGGASGSAGASPASGPSGSESTSAASAPTARSVDERGLGWKGVGARMMGMDMAI